MLPEIELFGRTFPMYGVCCVSGFLSSLLLVSLMGRKSVPGREDCVYVYVFSVIGAMLGAKIVYILTVLPQFLADFHYLFMRTGDFLDAYLYGGFVFYGGFAGAFLFAYLFASSYRTHLRDYLPVFVPSALVLAGFGRIGCFCAGCCYGKETDLPFGVVFHESQFAPDGVPLIPTQLIEASFDFLLALILFILIRKGLAGVSALLAYASSYSVFRFIIEFFRGDAVRGSLLGLSTSQWIACAVLLACVSFIAVRSGRKWIPGKRRP